MLNLPEMLNVFPVEVIDNGKFCFTAVGEKKPRDIITYAPIGANEINRTYREALESKHLRYANCIGLKVGNGISAIDIDDCITAEGVIADHAIEIIHHVKSYTEYSPSGRGVRILFRAGTKFDRTKWMIKNPKFKVEYYDADDQEANGGRMVRLSGNVAFDYDFRTADTLDILNKYLFRVKIESEVESVSGDVNPYKVKFISALTRRDPDYVTLYGRAFHGQSESEWDMYLVKLLYRLTTNRNEVKQLFEGTYYYNTKDKRHMDKWHNGYYANYVLEKTTIDANDEHPFKGYADLFDHFEPYEIDDHKQYRNEIISLCKEMKFMGLRFEPMIPSKVAIHDKHLLTSLLYFIALNRNYLEKVLSE